MKFWMLIFAFYLFGLSFASCVDNHTQLTNAEEVVAKHCGGREHHAELCSPFCLCNCCQTLVTKAEKPAIPKLFLSFSIEKKSYTQHYSLLLLRQIWQPPQA